MTPPEERRDELTEVERVSKATNQALIEFANTVVDRVAELAPEQFALLATAKAAVERDVAEATERLRQAQSQRGITSRMREWLKRTGEARVERGRREIRLTTLLRLTASLDVTADSLLADLLLPGRLAEP